MSDVKTQADALREHLADMRTEYERKVNEAIIRVNQAQEVLRNVDKTDTSENATYQDAVENYKNGEADLARYIKRRDAFMLYNDSNYTSTDVIKEGTTVELTNLNDGRKFTMLLVPHDLGDAEHNYLAIDSIVGASILGHRSHDKVTVKTIHGVIQYEIGEIY